MGINRDASIRFLIKNNDYRKHKCANSHFSALSLATILSCALLLSGQQSCISVKELQGVKISKGDKRISFFFPVTLLFYFIYFIGFFATVYLALGIKGFPSFSHATCF